MSGDCGHGWGYHTLGRNQPCQRCKTEWDKLNDDINALEEQALLGPLTQGLANKLQTLKLQAADIADNW